jgi:anti-sigma regulatory factor (Ser/Thr protein kinase)
MTTGSVSSQVLTAELLAPTNARRYARAACAGIAPPQLVDDVTLLVSELVTNATIHGEGEIGLVLRVSEGEVFITVEDHGRNVGSSPRAGEPLEEYGRGLTIVAEVASSWGVHSLGDAGKLVWCVVHAPTRLANAGWTSPGIPFLLGASERMSEPFATEAAQPVHQ